MTNITRTTEKANFGWLSDQLQTYIASFCDIPGAAALALTSRHNYAIATDDYSVWRVFARQINCPIVLENNALDQVQSFVADLREAMRENHNPNSADISFSKMLIQAPTIARINYLQRYLKARATLFVWKILAKKIDQPVPELDHLPTSKDIIAQASKFRAWCLQHQTAPSQITHLSNLNKPITNIPTAIAQIPHLPSLILTYNQLISLPPEIEKRAQLHRLLHSSNQTNHPTPTIDNSSQLQLLDLVI
ncbi:MAG: hypothetical protein K1000chlam2_01822, partial [Chlamydiae bacterium]|nr:hypothetical protein [Chlamydiota bacterium]